MKRLILHIGTHKTATTTFQRICFGLKHLLLENNIYYPELEDHPGINNHAALAWKLDQSNKAEGEEYLEKILDNPLSRECSTTLISSEDLENILVKHDILDRIIEVARRLNYDNIELVIVTRNPEEYLSSIYNQLSKHGAVLDYPTIASAADKTGYFACTLNHFNYIFAIEPMPLIAELQKKFPSILIHHYTFKDFTNIYAGREFLRKILPEKVANLIDMVDLKSHDILSSNESLEELEVEARYASNALGINLSGALDKELLELIKRIAHLRVARTKQGKALAHSLFNPKINPPQNSRTQAKANN